MRVRQVTSPLDPAIGRFGAMQRQIYFEADMLIPATLIRAMLGVPMTGRSNFLVVAEEGEELLGGTFFHHMVRPNTGFSSFMGILPKARGKGIARKLHQARFEVLDAAAGGRVNGVFIDVVAPERMSPQEIADEKRVDSDPVHRRLAFNALGFCKVEIAYRQPVGGPNGGPVINLDLLYCPREPSESVSTELVLETLRAYWTPWLGKGRAGREVQRLRELAEGEVLRLVSAV